MTFSDFVDLWVIKIKRSRSREQSTKRRSRSEKMRKFCLFYRLYDYQTWQTHLFGEIHGVRKDIWDFSFLIVFSGADWLSRQTSVIFIQSWPCSLPPEVQCCTDRPSTITPALFIGFFFLFHFPPPHIFPGRIALAPLIRMRKV